MRRLVPCLLVLMMAMTVLAPVAAQPIEAQPAVTAAVDWLRAQQQDDGGFAGFSGSSDGGVSADVALAFAAVGADPHTIRRASPLGDFLFSVGDTYGATTGGAAKLAVAAVAMGSDPHAIGRPPGLIDRIITAHDPTTGLYDTQLFSHAYAVLALVAAGEQVPPDAVDALVARQIADGSWAFSGSTDPGQGDSNTTAIAIQALVAAGRADSDAVRRGLDYLAAAQTNDGSFVYQVGAESPPVGDANSSALAIQALVAAGQDPDTDTWKHATAALARFQNPSGAFRYRDDFPDDSLLATAQAIPALMKKALPLPWREWALEGALPPAGPIDRADCVFYAETGHNLCGGFRAYWEQFGGLAVYGYPISEEFRDYDTGATTQYFERARFEWIPGQWPERYDVSLGLLGAELTAGRRAGEAFAPAQAAPTPDCTFYPETGHNLCGGFRAYWQQYGGLAVYGMPISEEFREVNPDTGEEYTVQYFERQRFEWHPGEWPERYDVMLGRLGVQRAEAQRVGP